MSLKGFATVPSIKPWLIPGNNSEGMLVWVSLQSRAWDKDTANVQMYREYIWKLIPESSMGVGMRWGRKGCQQMRCYYTGFHCGQLGPDPIRDPVRNHGEQTSKLSSQRMGVWRHCFPLMPGYHCLKLAPGVFTLGYFQAVSAQGLGELLWLWRKHQGRKVKRSADTCVWMLMMCMEANYLSCSWNQKEAQGRWRGVPGESSPDTDSCIKHRSTPIVTTQQMLWQLLQCVNDWLIL